MLSPHSPITAAKNYNTKGTISSQAETTEAGEKKKEEEEELNMDVAHAYMICAEIFPVKIRHHNCKKS
jgi:hypothetical protein